jgi:ribosomal protein S27AE
MEWHCFKDYSLMTEVDLQLEDLEDHHKFFHKGMKCPKCGLAFVELDWYCYKDNVKMEEADIQLVYELSADHKMSSVQKGLSCPVCGLSFFLEYFTLTRLVSAEEMFETK